MYYGRHKSEAWGELYYLSYNKARLKANVFLIHWNNKNLKVAMGLGERVKTNLCHNKYNNHDLK